MNSTPFHSGQVDWSGDNPGMFLREAADGPFVTLMVWFRITVSKHGPGHVMVLFEEPNQAKSLPDVANICIADNEALARYLIENFCKKFGAFRDSAAFDAVEILPMTELSEAPEGSESFTVRVSSADVNVELLWDDLGEAFAADVPPDRSATGAHEMYSCFVEAHKASIRVNGRKLKGEAFPRDFMGRPTSSAFLAFSEIWIKA